MRLPVCMVQAICREGVLCSDQRIYITGHLGRRVNIMGVVVATYYARNKNVVMVDDGTGVIPCVDWYNDNDERRQSLNENAILGLTGYDVKSWLGRLVNVQGTIAGYKDEVQITMHRTLIVTDSDGSACSQRWENEEKLWKCHYSTEFGPNS